MIARMIGDGLEKSFVSFWLGVRKNVEPHSGFTHYQGSIMEIKLTKQQKVTVKGAQDICPIMRQILRRENKIGQGQEHF